MKVKLDRQGIDQIEIVMKLPREDVVSLHNALDYAIGDRQYEADSTTDTEDREAILACVQDWVRIQGEVSRCLGWLEV